MGALEGRVEFGEDCEPQELGSEPKVETGTDKRWPWKLAGGGLGGGAGVAWPGLHSPACPGLAGSISGDVV